MENKFVWIHIKKCGGQSTRLLLEPQYSQVDRSSKPPSFKQERKKHWNDILNNYRTLIGGFQFKRALYAKKFLWPKLWKKILSFTIVRDPIKRCISMFHYMFTGRSELSICDILKKTVRRKSNLYSYRYRFDYFLEQIKVSFLTDDIYEPLSLHFNTHVNTVHRDVTDNNGSIIVDRVYLLEDLFEAIRQIKEDLGYEMKQKGRVHLNETKNGKYVPTREQKRKIRNIYQRDFEIYENARSIG